MVKRPLSQRMVTDVVAEQPGAMAGAVGEVIEAGINFQKLHDKAKIDNFTTDANIKMMEVSNQWRNEYKNDPFSKSAQADLSRRLNEIPGSYSKEVGVLSRQDFNAQMGNLVNQYKQKNAQWGIKQSVVNTENLINTNIKKNLQLAYEQGVEGDFESAIENFSNTKSQLEEQGELAKGFVDTNTLLKNYKSDYTKMVLSGVMKNDPDRVVDMLENNETVKNNIGDPATINEMKLTAKKRKAELNIDSIISNQSNLDEAYRILNSEESTYPEKQDALLIIGQYADGKSLKLAQQSLTNQETIAKRNQPNAIKSIANQIASLKKTEKEKKEVGTDTSNLYDYLNKIRDTKQMIHDAEGLSPSLKTKFIDDLNTAVGTTKAEIISKFEDKNAWFTKSFDDAYKDLETQFNGNSAQASIAFVEYVDQLSKEGIKPSEDYNNNKSILNNVVNSLKAFNREQAKSITADSLGQATSEGMQEFDSPEEADNSGLPKGTVVLIGGRRYEI